MTFVMLVVNILAIIIIIIIIINIIIINIIIHIYHIRSTDHSKYGRGEGRERERLWEREMFWERERL